MEQNVQTQSPAEINPNETDWEEVRDLGLDPAPAGMAADEEDFDQSEA